ncbi:MAG: FAD-dependent oxidoreductase [Acidobacteria bacterium]|nr:FAD-dependent oxidoreductase [Acidobacteriota bacterium]
MDGRTHLPPPVAARRRRGRRGGRRARRGYRPGAPAAGGPGGPDRPPPRRGRPRHVVIIGAGIAGLTAAYELRRAGHRCTVLEASHRAGGRNLTLRRGDIVDEVGARQVCEFDDHPDLYFNAGPARIPGSHTSLLRYCRELGVRLEVFVNDNRNAWVQDDAAFGGRPIRSREYMTDARGFVAELLAKAVHPRDLDARLDAGDQERLRAFLRVYGDLDETLAYRGSERAGYASGGMMSPGVRKPVRGFSELLDADFWREYMHWGEMVDQAAPMMQPVGGMDRIVDAFLGRVGDAVELRAIVREIRLGESGVEVAYADARGDVRSVRGDYCLNSMPAHLVPGLRHNLPPRYVRALAAPTLSKNVKVAFQARRRDLRRHLLDQPGHHPDLVPPARHPRPQRHHPGGLHLGRRARPPARPDVAGRARRGGAGPGREGPSRLPAARRAGPQRGLVPDEPRARLLDPLDGRGVAEPSPDAAGARRTALPGRRSGHAPRRLAGRRHPVGLPRVARHRPAGAGGGGRRLSKSSLGGGRRCWGACCGGLPRRRDFGGGGAAPAGATSAPPVRREAHQARSGDAALRADRVGRVSAGANPSQSATDTGRNVVWGMGLPSAAAARLSRARSGAPTVPAS